MKKFSVLMAVGLGGILCLSAVNTRAELEVSASVSIHAAADFDAPLAGRGTWVTIGSYGRCWRPAGVVVGWQPYGDGEWVWTDCGWYWESDEPWAWACYHYGYWVYDPVYGWVWIPGLDWAPAWVCWRIGGGCIGWAPLGPPGHFAAHHPIDAAFVFVDNDHFSGHIGSSVIIHGDRHDLMNRTKFISNIRFSSRDVDGHKVGRVAINEGPGLAAVQKATGRHFRVEPMSAAVGRTPVPSSLQHGPAQKENNRGPKSLAPPHEKGNSAPAQQRGPDRGSAPHSQPGPGPHGDQGGDHGQGGGHGEGHGHGHDRGD